MTALNERNASVSWALRFPPWKMAFLDPKQSTFLGQKSDPAAWHGAKWIPTTTTPMDPMDPTDPMVPKAVCHLIGALS